MTDGKNASPCRYVALDIPKHYSVIAAVNRDGRIVLIQPVQTLISVGHKN